MLVSWRKYHRKITEIFKCFSIEGIMAVWLIAGIATTIFICLFDTEDFKTRLNMKQPPELFYKLTLIGSMAINLLFCYIWEVKLNTNAKFNNLYDNRKTCFNLGSKSKTLNYFRNRFLFWTSYYSQGYCLYTRSASVVRPCHLST